MRSKKEIMEEFKKKALDNNKQLSKAAITQLKKDLLELVAKHNLPQIKNYLNLELLVE